MKTVVLDDAMVLGLPAPRKGKRTYHYDGVIQGFGVAITDKGTKTFIYYRKINGSPKRITLGHFPHMSVEAARQRAKEFVDNIENSAVSVETTSTGPQEIVVQAARRPQRRAFYMGVFAAALSIVLLVTLVTSVLSHWQSDEALQSVISFAIDDHLNHREVSFHSQDPAQIKKTLEQQLPFEVEIPRITPDLKVSGGRTDKVGENSVAYSLWNGKSNHIYSLLQFRRVDFGVSPAATPQLVRPEGMAVKHTPCEVLYWSKGEYGFVLVADHGELLQGVAPELGSAETAQAETRW